MCNFVSLFDTALVPVYRGLDEIVETLIAGQETASSVDFLEEAKAEHTESSSQVEDLVSLLPAFSSQQTDPPLEEGVTSSQRASPDVVVILSSDEDDEEAPCARCVETEATLTVEDPVLQRLRQAVLAAISELRKQATVDNDYRRAMELIITVTEKIRISPDEPKYKRIKMDNQAFWKKAGHFYTARCVMEAIGWKDVENAMVFEGVVDPALLWFACSELKSKLDMTGSAGVGRAGPSNSEPVSAKLKRTHEDSGGGVRHKRPKWEAEAANASAKWTGGKKINDRMKNYQADMKRKFESSTTRQGRKRVFSMEDMAEISKGDAQRQSDPVKDKTGPRVHTMQSTLFDPEKLGREMLALTNDFRKKEKKSKMLEWHVGMVQPAIEHSKNMGDKKCPFGHHGFKERIQKFEFHYSSAGENVHMVKGANANLAEIAVDGWIKSPGHRKNLLGDWTHCVIGVVQNGEGAWYSTQLFART